MVTDPADVPARFAQAWNEGDADGIAALFAEDADFVNVVGLWWRKRSAIRKAHDYGLRTFFAGSTLSIRRVEVRQLSDDIAVVHGKWRLEGQRASGGGAGGQRTGIMVFVTRRLAGSWTVVTAQNTDIVPGAESIVADGPRRFAVDYRTHEP
ncbi:SgcJ/EcaC family oxidoreductase [Saccharopolyspora taberi]|uniref:SgcJ/EcaC family oxidoreductase n=1 Tax=Saccharopolyspora taberi TaxID=60895 RepID=A0ABN3VHM3_9PSEU